MPNSRIHRTCICEKSAEAQIRVYIGKQNCAHFDIAIAQEAYTGDWYPRTLVPLICTEIGNEASEFSVISLPGFRFELKARGGHFGTVCHSGERHTAIEKIDAHLGTIGVEFESAP